MARSRRGGYRRPSSPAAASGPGSLSQRTDGAPGDMRMGRGLDYGDNARINALQSAAPVGGPPQAGPSGGPLVGGTSPMPANGVFGQSDRPGEPLTAGVDAGAGPGAPLVPKFSEDVNYMVRAIAAENPHLADYLLGLADA